KSGIIIFSRNKSSTNDNKETSLTETSSKLLNYQPRYDRDGKELSLSDIIRFLEDECIENITLIDVREKCDFTNWMIIGEGKTINHLVGAAGSLYKMLKDNIKHRNENQSNSFINNYPVVEGRDSDDWVLIDSGNIFVHLFTPEARKYRDLEGLWENVLIPSSSEERMRQITKDIEQEFKNYDPKFIKHPHLSKCVDSVD
ncbi:7492_t:CDS:2, partial [Gigaspora rosea]